VTEHSLYVDKFTRLFYLLIQLVRATNYGRWWLQSEMGGCPFWNKLLATPMHSLKHPTTNIQVIP